ncbi:MAG TPA: hypothetical protein DD640_03410, partial [Clostridiales bacterium]|nr:hypothetical protein [Clostridiales bacterium]
MQLTPEQTAVVMAEPGNLLVSAAAGSGKTAVLTSRIVRRIIDGKLDIRSVLVVTFTDAAARNMKEKIQAKLQEALDSTAEPAARRHLSRQLSLLPGAAISTIHAFCLDVIRNFYTCARDELGQPLIEQGFGVEDSVEMDMLLRRTLDEWMSSQYEQLDLDEDNPPDDPEEKARTAAKKAAFYRLTEGYGSSKSDQPVRDLMLGLYSYLRSLPDYAGCVASWLADLEAAASDFSASPHLEALLRQLRLRLDRALSRLDELQDLLTQNIRLSSDIKRNLEQQRLFRAALEALCDLDAYLSAGGRDWDHIRCLSGALAEIDWPRSGKNDSPEKSGFLDLMIQTVAEVIYFLTGCCGTKKFSQKFIFETQPVFNLPAAQIEADIRAMLPPVRLLFELILGLDRQFAQNKRAAGVIDFADFEHLALAILRRNEPKQYYRKRFREIYVDEYQDTSSIQEAVIQAVSDGNCLMVGDVKQS